ncbi:MAG TPA: serine/threonine-protein kinase [Polyangia bacterium]|jgi:serine/threonine protein kinase|nr:serine/threonine-protein kinase [Polyangia bacterium]
MAVHGRYTIVGKLADGGMAEIFLALQNGIEGFEKPVVLKRILTAFSVDAQFRNMFIDEAHISMTLSHSNIVQVLDLGMANGRYFLVLELVDGWDLDKIIKRARASNMVWPTALSLYLAAEVCRALAFAHGKSRGGKPLGIVHRDVSPNNVLISEQGEVKLADFGIAKAQQKREKTAAGVIKGKVAFMSPEQAAGGALDRRSDLFSVGSMLYLMVTDKLPFEAPTDLESLLRVQRAEYPPPQEAKSTVGDAVARIITRAMRRDPGERYQAADEMLADVERVLRNDFQSAGQTELKSWLEQLARRDGTPTIGKTAAPGTNDSGAPGEVVETDLSAGTSFELGDLDAASGLTDVAPGPFPTPPPVPASAGAQAWAPRRAERTGDTAIERFRRRAAGRGFGGFWLGALFALAALFGVRYLWQWADGQGWLTGPPPSVASVDAAVVANPAPVAAAAGGSAAPPVAVSARSPDHDPASLHKDAISGAIAAAVPDAQAAPVANEWPYRPPPGPPPVEVAVPVAAAKPADDDDPDEEALLRGADPDPEHAVIGEDEAEPAPPPPPSKSASKTAAVVKAKTEPAREVRAENKPAPTKPGAPPPPASAPAQATTAAPAAAATTISLHITTNPVGAIVRTKQRVLGRTPINLRFKTPNIYELTFLKSGYVPTTKKVSVSGTRNRDLAVSMKKHQKRGYLLFRPHR